MEFGPFQITESEQIKHMLRTHNVAFECILDEDLRDKLLKEYHERASQAPRASMGTLDLKIIFFEISDDDYQKVKHELEKLGIASVVSDGSWELGED